MFTVRYDTTDIEVCDWCWLEVDYEEGDLPGHKRTAEERRCVLRGIGQGGRWHHGPTMPWQAWLALARAVVSEYGDLADGRAELSGGGLVAGSMMAIRPSDARGAMWSGWSPRNGQWASCEGTLAEVVGLAKSILEWDSNI